MRKSRLKVDETAYYHCMSRVIEQRFIMGERDLRCQPICLPSG